MINPQWFYRRVYSHFMKAWDVLAWSKFENRWYHIEYDYDSPAPLTDEVYQA